MCDNYQVLKIHSKTDNLDVTDWRSWAKIYDYSDFVAQTCFI